jgi:predicted metal-dependent peptidase
VGNLKKINIYLPDTTELFNPLNAELNPICHLLALLGHCILHVSRIRVKHKAPGATFYATSVIMHWEAWMDVPVYYAEKFNIFVQW